MTAESPITAPRRASRSWVLPLLIGAGGIYVGMRWHSTFERWLVPSAATSPATATTAADDAKPADGKRQLWTCGMHPQVIQDHPGDCPICHMKLTPLAVGGSAGGPPAAEGSVTIDPAVVQNMGVRTVQVAAGPLEESVRLTAMVTEPEPGHHDINLRVSGWIQTLHAAVDGMEVHQGDPLFDLYSPELRLAIEELIAARKSVDRTTDGSVRAGAEAMAAAAESRLVALGLTPEQAKELGAMERAPDVVTFRSPLTAHVTEKAGVYSGSSVMAGQRIFRLAERKTMWIDGRLPERLMGRVRVGQRAKIRTQSQPSRELEAEVIFIHPHLDEMTRTALVRMSVPNHDYALHEGMYATAQIDVGDSTPTILVPREAVIDTGETKLVFVSTGRGHFEPRRVELGRGGAAGSVQVLSGLKAGETVVASGQFLIDSESRLREAVSKFLGQTPTSPSGGVTPPPSPQPLPSLSVINRSDAVAAAYLPLAETLGAQIKDTPPLNVDALVTAIEALGAEDGAGDVGRLAGAAAAATKALREKTTDQQRELFKVASAAVIALLDAAPPSPAVAAVLVVVNCPMAKGDWLQRTTQIANPYYADDMKECGSVVRSLAPKGGR